MHWQKHQTFFIWYQQLRISGQQDFQQNLWDNCFLSGSSLDPWRKNLDMTNQVNEPASWLGCHDHHPGYMVSNVLCNAYLHCKGLVPHHFRITFIVWCFTGTWVNSSVNTSCKNTRYETPPTSLDSRYDLIR